MAKKICKMLLVYLAIGAAAANLIIEIKNFVKMLDEE